MADITEADRLFAEGIPLTLRNQESGQTLDVHLRYSNRSIKMLEDEFGSIEDAAQALAELQRRESDDEVETILALPDWRLDAQQRDYGRAVLKAVMAPRGEPLKRVDKLVRLVAAGLLRPATIQALTQYTVTTALDITSDVCEAMVAATYEWVVFREFGDLVMKVNIAMLQAMPMVRAGTATPPNRAARRRRANGITPSGGSTRSRSRKPASVSVTSGT